VAELNELRTETRGLEGAPGRRPRTFGIIIVLIFITGLGAAGGGAAGLIAVASRHPTQAQISVAGQREFAVLWQRLPAGKIFPASVGYVNSLGADTTATLVGIAPRAPCASAVDARAAAALAAAGCLTVLRATYADASRTALVTIGIAVMRSADGADMALRALGGSGHGGLLPVSFPGTVASLFTGKARETATAQSAAGPYLFLYAAGYADGRSTGLGPRTGAAYLDETVTTDLGAELVVDLAAAFQQPANPCSDRNVRC
jgi:hypothetical protein